ncbi:MAG TPA: cytochrome c biogenesis protein CcdA [Streptosporangiaceae bacterium]|nr:cytochrome c biogenesis protein CcdA [Streptosporangiaceae bacterium]
MSIVSLVADGPLLLAMPVAAAAGALTFLSPCVLPLVPGYLSYITGMSGASLAGSAASGGAALSAVASGGPDAGGPEPGEPEDGGGAGAVVGVGAGQAATGQAGAGQAGRAVVVTGAGGAVAGVGTAVTRPARGRTVAGALLFVLGFSVLFSLYGAAFGAVGVALQDHYQGLSRILGGVLILLGLLFAGAFDRFSFAGRIVKPSARPRAGLAGAPLLGMLFGLGWTPCAGPTLSAVMTLTVTTGTAARGAVLAFVYALGVGIPFLIVAVAVDRGMAVFGFARRHARMITRIGGMLLIAVGLLEVTGAWTSAVIWLKAHWFGGYYSPL